MYCSECGHNGYNRAYMSVMYVRCRQRTIHKGDENMNEKTVQEQKAEVGFDFIPVEAGSGGGRRGSSMNAEGLKQIIDSVDKILESFKKQNEGKCPGVTLKTINEVLGMSRTSLAGIQETLNMRAFNYLRAKKLWFHSNRNTKNKSGHVWLDREKAERFDKLSHYSEKSILTEKGEKIEVM